MQQPFAPLPQPKSARGSPWPCQMRERGFSIADRKRQSSCCEGEQSAFLLQKWMLAQAQRAIEQRFGAALPRGRDHISPWSCCYRVWKKHGEKPFLPASARSCPPALWRCQEKSPLQSRRGQVSCRNESHHPRQNNFPREPLP